MIERSRSVLVITRYQPEEIEWNVENDEPVVDIISLQNDYLDKYNHPRYRRALILKELDRRNCNSDNNITFSFETPSEKARNLDFYHKVHSARLIDFFTTAWQRWDELGEGGQDSMCNGGGGIENVSSPALIPGNVSLPRDIHQRPSQNVMGQMGFFCTDTCTPIFDKLMEEILWDLAVVQHAVASLIPSKKVVYALGTHPGHHSAHDSFGGYCYVNQAALAARLLQQQNGLAKVAILDVDYHCGNGSASIFYEDPTVLVVSIHCHPDCEYPFHSGYFDEDGAEEGKGSTLHLPLLPGTTWQEYSTELQQAMEAIKSFGAQSLVVSLGLDTYNGDPCAIRRAGFKLEGQDYLHMGEMIASSNLQTIVIQEGGYYMEMVPQAVADFLYGMSSPTPNM
jgi:acetoin utilization deacetylase AcuC-like enzyme